MKTNKDATKSEDTVKGKWSGDHQKEKNYQPSAMKITTPPNIS